METFRIAVKSFIVNEKGDLFLIKRRENDPHKPGVWEIPGGRLEQGESPFIGLKRETKEETGLDIEILHPLTIHHFTRDDGQTITMIVFLCKPLSGEVTLSKEHTEYVWSSLENSLSLLDPRLHEDVRLVKNKLRHLLQ